MRGVKHFPTIHSLLTYTDRPCSEDISSTPAIATTATTATVAVAMVAAGVCISTTSTSKLTRDAQWSSCCSCTTNSSVSGPVFKSGGWRSTGIKKGDTKRVLPNKNFSDQVSITVTNLGRLKSNRPRELDLARPRNGFALETIICRSDQRHHDQGTIFLGRSRAGIRINEQHPRRRHGRFSKCSSPAAAALGGQRLRIQNEFCRGGGGRRRQRKVWAAADDGEEDIPLDESYWEGAEGREQLNEIEAMKELIAEAEILRKAESTSTEGVETDGQLSEEEIQKQRIEKLREELARRARQQAEQRKQAETMFSMGQRAYGRGVYDKSVQLLEAALSNVPTSTQLGGEIQIWLAMAYEANNRHGDCIALYRRLEATHPNKKLRRQAAELRYILEAPKLKISREEMVTIPLIERDYDRGYRKSWRQQVRDRKQKPAPAKPKTKDYLEDWLVWDPPRWERSPYFWVAVTVWLTLIGVSLMFQD